MAALFAVAAYRFNGALEARRETDRDSGQNFVTIRLIVGADLALVGVSLAVTWLFVPGLHGVGFVGLVLGLFGASSLLGEFRWSKARARRILALVFLAACAVVAVLVLALGWLSPTWGCWPWSAPWPRWA